jgi:hypothetical protein
MLLSLWSSCFDSCVHLYAYNNVRTTERIFIKFEIGVFYQKLLSDLFQCSLGQRILTMTLHEYVNLSLDIEYLHFCSNLCFPVIFPVRTSTSMQCMVYIFPVMFECSTFAEITGNYKLSGASDSQRSQCAIIVTLCGLQDEQHRQCTYKCNIEVHSFCHCCSGKAIIITNFECVQP